MSARKRRPRKRLPGDLSDRALLERIVRVDQAGEFGAVQIYKGQLAVLAGTKSEPVITEMAAAEDVHLAAFDRLLVERRVRPTALTPIWRAAGFMLGAGTALIGEKAAMACTEAVEEVIVEHYRNQAEALGDDEPELKKTIEAFAAEEEEHRQTAIDHESERAPAYPALSRGIRAGTRLAIWLSERI